MKNNTVNSYKVIKSFGEAVVNDLFVYDEKNDLFAMQSEEVKANYSVSRSMKLDPVIAVLLCDEGYLEMSDAIMSSNECSNCTKLDMVKNFIYKQIEVYKKESTDIADKFDKGEIQPCVKVESDTVHYNLLKVLNTIKDIINE